MGTMYSCPRNKDNRDTVHIIGVEDLMIPHQNIDQVAKSKKMGKESIVIMLILFKQFFAVLLRNPYELDC